MKNGALSNSLGVRFYIGSILCTELHRAVFGYVVGLTLYRGLCPDAWNDPLFFPVPVTIALALNMDIGQGCGSHYTFEKHYFNQQHVRLNFAKALCGAFSKNHN